MRRLPSPVSIDRLFWALCANAVLLGLILLALLGRGGHGVDLASPAFAQAGVEGSTVNKDEPLSWPAVVMPGQLSPNVWGCYLLDNQRQTLCVYEYLHNEGLRLVAARDVRYDRVLKNFNTAPSPAEMQALGQQPQGTARALHPGTPSESQTGDAGNPPR